MGIRTPVQSHRARASMPRLCLYRLRRETCEQSLVIVGSLFSDRIATILITPLSPCGHHLRKIIICTYLNLSMISEIERKPKLDQLHYSKDKVVLCGKQFRNFDISILKYQHWIVFHRSSTLALWAEFLYCIVGIWLFFAIFSLLVQLQFLYHLKNRFGFYVWIAIFSYLFLVF